MLKHRVSGALTAKRHNPTLAKGPKGPTGAKVAGGAAGAKAADGARKQHPKKQQTKKRVPTDASSAERFNSALATNLLDHKELIFRVCIIVRLCLFCLTPTRTLTGT